MSAAAGSQADAGLAGGADGVLVLPGPLADLATGDQQDLVGTVEDVAERGRVILVDGADNHTAVSEIFDPGGGTAGRDNVLGGNTAIQQVLGDEAAEVAGGAGDDD